MRLIHFDYIRLVKALYKQKQANHEQPLLTRSTPANIRRECLNVLQERFHRKDEGTLRAFFGPAESKKQFLQSIEGLETDRFKPLHNYLKGLTENTEDKNLELLAWLLDFKHRPFRTDNDIELTPEERSLIDKTDEAVEELPKSDSASQPDESSAVSETSEYEKHAEPSPNASPDMDTVSTPKRGNKKLTPVLIACLTLAIGAGGSYMMMANTDPGCMSWVGDRYQQVPCPETPDGSLILPLHKQTLQQLKKINREDTITELSIGKLYYIKDSNDIQYYTIGGKYPEDPNRSLKKLTRRIFDKDSVNRKPSNQQP